MSVLVRAFVLCSQPVGTLMLALMSLCQPLAQAQPVAADVAQAQQQFQQGVQWLRQGKTDKATAVFEQLVLSHPGLVEAHNNLGVLYAAQGRLGDARQALEAGLRASRSVGAWADEADIGQLWIPTFVGMTIFWSSPPPPVVPAKAGTHEFVDPNPFT